MKVDSLLTIDKGELDRRTWERLLLRLTFADAEGNDVSAFQYVSGKDQVLLPRGAWDMLPDKLKVDDLRSRPLMPKISFDATLDAEGFSGQAKAVRAMFRNEQGQVIAQPGFGKTQTCLAFAAACRTRVLVLVHTHDLLKQWTTRAQEVVPGMSLGKIQGQTCQVEHLTIATAQTLKRHLHEGGLFWRQFGCIIVDETHHAAAETWEWILNVCPAYYRFGVSASQRRSDGREGLVRFNVGPVIFKSKFKSAVPITIEPIQTGFKTKYNGTQYTRVIQTLVRDEARNELIAKIAADEIRAGSSVLILSRQILHLENIYAQLMVRYPFAGTGVKIVTGRVPKGQRDKLIGQLRDGSLRCILGTQLFEEGVDIPRLNRIILAYPGTEITALQKIGRGSRAHVTKVDCIVYDLLDDLVRCLAKQYLRRRTWYKSVNIPITKVRKYGDSESSKAKVRRPKGKTRRRASRLFAVARGGR